MIVTGCGIACIGAAFSTVHVVPFAQDVNRHSRMPFWILRIEATVFADGTTRHPALDEIHDRIYNERLSRRQLRAITRDALARQAQNGGRLPDEWMEVIKAVDVVGAMEPAQSGWTRIPVQEDGRAYGRERFRSR
jgi:hypothetical protein